MISTTAKTPLSNSNTTNILSLLLNTLLALTLLATPCTSFSDQPPQKFYGGAGVGRFTLDSDEYSWQCAYEMVLVERILAKPKTDGGLFVPTEDMPKLHLCRGTFFLYCLWSMCVFVCVCCRIILLLLLLVCSFVVCY